MEWVLIIFYTVVTTVATLYVGACALVGWIQFHIGFMGFRKLYSLFVSYRNCNFCMEYVGSVRGFGMREVFKDGVYMFTNSDLFVIEDGTITYPDYLWFWIKKNIEAFMSASIYLGEL